MKNKLIILLVVFLLLTGCGANDEVETQNYLKLQATQSQVVSGAMAVPWLYPSVANFSYRTLFTANAKVTEVIPDLVDTYNISDDGCTYEFTLKDNLFWSDGEELNLEDVLFSFESIAITEQVHSLFKYSLDNIVGIKEYINGDSDHIIGIYINNDTLTVKLEKPMHTFLSFLSQFTILPKHGFINEDIKQIHTSDFWLNPIVSGIYKMGDKVEGEYITYEFNEYYSENKPNIEKFMLRADYELIDIDYTATNSATQMLTLRSNSLFREYDVKAQFYNYILFNMNQNNAEETAVDDVRVRTAIIQAIDFKTILNQVYYNAKMTDEMNYQVYDMDTAKLLLDEAEYDFSKPLVLLTPFVDADTELLMKKMGEELEKVGFQIEIIMGGNLYTDIYDVAINSLSSIGDIHWFMEYDETNDLTKYVFGDCSELNILLDELEATTTQEEYNIAYENLQKMSIEKVYKFPMITMNQKIYVNKTRIEIPEDLVFGNTRYKFDTDLTNWKFVENLK